MTRSLMQADDSKHEQVNTMNDIGSNELV